MAISNVNTSNQPASASRTTSTAPTHAVRRERPREDQSESAVVTLSADAQNLQRAESEQKYSQEHIERISALNRSDQMAQEKMASNAREEVRVLAEKRKEDEQFYKRINVVA